MACNTAIICTSPDELQTNKRFLVELPAGIVSERVCRAVDLNVPFSDAPSGESDSPRRCPSKVTTVESIMP